MKVKTFHALTMQDAIRSIKEQLGSDAVILSTRRIRKGGTLFGLFGRSMVEVVAAIEPDLRGASAAHRRQVAQASSRRTPRDEGTSPEFRRALRESLIETRSRPGNQSAPPPSDGRPAPASPARERPNTPRPAESVRCNAPHDGTAEHAGEPRDSAPSLEPHAWHRIRAELHDLRDILLQTGGQDAGRWLEGVAPRLRETYYDLLRIGLEPQTVRTILLDVQQRTPAGRAESEASLRPLLHRALARHVQVSGPLLAPAQQKKSVLFVGPTGVGKTTTIAKLAAHYRLREGRRVSLITMDTYRVAAVEQLRTYATVIGVTMDVALTQQEALDCIHRRRQADLILIDTAGRSPNEKERTEEVERLATADHPTEVHLVLSATTRDRDLMEGVARYAGIPINRLLFTKLDETQFLGGVFELMRRTGLPLSYFSVGQRVPEDLEVVTPERVADLILAAAAGTLSAGRLSTRPDGAEPETSETVPERTHHATTEEGAPEWIRRW